MVIYFFIIVKSNRYTTVSILSRAFTVNYYTNFFVSIHFILVSPSLVTITNNVLRQF